MFDISTLTGTMVPIITEAPSNTPATIGGRFTLTCTAVGIPLPTITWSSNSDNSIATTSSTEIDFSTIQSELTFSDLQANDFEMYTCTATNTVGSDNGTAILGSEFITTVIINFFNVPVQ